MQDLQVSACVGPVTESLIITDISGAERESPKACAASSG